MRGMKIARRVIYVLALIPAAALAGVIREIEDSIRGYQIGKAKFGALMLTGCAYAFAWSPALFGENFGALSCGTHGGLAVLLGVYMSVGFWALMSGIRGALRVDHPFNWLRALRSLLWIGGALLVQRCVLLAPDCCNPPLDAAQWHGTWAFCSAVIAAQTVALALQACAVLRRLPSRLRPVG